MDKLVVSGKRKTAIARAIIVNGEGKVTINNNDYKNLQFLSKLRIEEPIRIADNILGKRNFNIEITVAGGGDKGQIEAARVALARAISKFMNNPKLTEAFQEYDRNLLVADVRRKEAYKPGDSKARKRRQSSKR